MLRVSRVRRLAGSAERSRPCQAGAGSPGTTSRRREATSPFAGLPVNGICSVFLERRHRQPGVAELLPVELGRLALAASRRSPGRCCGSGRRSGSPGRSETLGITRASVRATWSKVLWLSFRTITRQAPPAPGARAADARLLDRLRRHPLPSARLESSSDAASPVAAQALPELLDRRALPRTRAASRRRRLPRCGAASLVDELLHRRARSSPCSLEHPPQRAPPARRRRSPHAARDAGADPRPRRNESARAAPARAPRRGRSSAPTARRRCPAAASAGGRSRTAGSARRRRRRRRRCRRSGRSRRRDGRRGPACTRRRTRGPATAIVSPPSSDCGCSAPGPARPVPRGAPSRRRRAAAALCSSLVGIDQVRRAALVDPHLELGEPLDERPRRAGVVEVDVGQQQRLRRLRSMLAEQRLHAALGPGVDERAAQVPAADHPLAADVAHVDQPGVSAGHRHQANVTDSVNSLS